MAAAPSVPMPSRFAGVTHVYTGNLYGGIESLLTTMARSPLFRGQSYALMFRGRLYEELEAAGADVFEIGSFRLRHPWQVFGARRRLRAGLSARDTHTVVTHMSIPHALASPVVGDRTLVYFAHEFHLGRHWSERWARLSRHPDGALANSAHVAPSIRRLFPNVTPSVVFCAAALDTPGDTERARVRAELSTPETDRVIAITCRISRYKGHLVLLEALSRLRSQTGWTAWIAGGPQTPDETELYSELRERARALGIESRVRFLGERRDVLRLLAASDMHCQPNTQPEHFGICFVEALAAGLPVITTAIGGALEIVTPGLGTLVPPGDPAALSRALETALQEPSYGHYAREHGPTRARELCAPEAFADRFGGALDHARERRKWPRA